MYQNILVINMLHIGDLLLATPVLRTLRANYPSAHIALMADAKIDDLVRYNQHIDELISVDKKGYHNKLSNYIRLIAQIRKRKFDLVINLHANERASAIAAFSGAKKIVGYSSPGFGVFFDKLTNNENFDFKVKNRPDILHQAAEHLEMLKQTLGIQIIDDNGLEMWTDPATEKKAELMWNDTFQNASLPVIGFNTGASWPTKRWTPEGFAEVADMLLDKGFGIAFFGGPMDVDNVNDIIGKMRHQDTARIAVFTGKVSLLELAALINKCRVFLTNDSGPMHVAVAQKANVVSIFGSSNEVGFGPYNPQDVVITTAIDCRPCGQHHCEHHSCMKNIRPDQVYKEILKIIEVTRQLKPAVFFDRDGVLNVDHGYVYCKDNFEWIPGAIDAIKLLNSRGYLVFVITNQSGVGRGYYQEEDVIALHHWMSQELKKEGAQVNSFYYCPHHSEACIEKYRSACECRKPQPGLLLQAMAEWPVEKSQSFMIGDKQSDMEAAQNAGIVGYLFKGGNLLHFLEDKLTR